MTVARRKILRPQSHPALDDAQRIRRRQHLQANLEKANASLGRWQSRLRRAFNSVERLQNQITRLSRQIQKLEA